MLSAIASYVGKSRNDATRAFGSGFNYLLTRHDMETLIANARMIEEQYGITIPRDRKSLIELIEETMREHPEELPPTHTSDDELAQYSADTGVLQVEAASSKMSYKCVPYELGMMALAPNTRQRALAALMGNPKYRFVSPFEKTLVSRGFGVNRCPRCHLFADNTHACAKVTPSLRNLSNHDKSLIDAARTKKMGRRRVLGIQEEEVFRKPESSKQFYALNPEVTQFKVLLDFLNSDAWSYRLRQCYKPGRVETRNNAFIRAMPINLATRTWKWHERGAGWVQEVTEDTGIEPDAQVNHANPSTRPTRSDHEARVESCLRNQVKEFSSQRHIMNWLSLNSALTEDRFSTFIFVTENGRDFFFTHAVDFSIVVSASAGEFVANAAISPLPEVPTRCPQEVSDYSRTPHGSLHSRALNLSNHVPSVPSSATQTTNYIPMANEIKWAQKQDPKQSLAIANNVMEKLDGHYAINCDMTLSEINFQHFYDPVTMTELFPADAPTSASLTGSLLMHKDPDTWVNTLVSSLGVNCNCPEYSKKFYCAHIRLIEMHAIGLGEIIQTEGEVAPEQPSNREDMFRTERIGSLYGNYSSSASLYAQPEYKMQTRENEPGEVSRAFLSKKGSVYRQTHLGDNTDSIDHLVTTEFLDTFDSVEEFLAFRRKYVDIYFEYSTTEFLYEVVSKGGVPVYAIQAFEPYDGYEYTEYTVRYYCDNPETGKISADMEVLESACRCGTYRIGQVRNPACKHFDDIERIINLKVMHANSEITGRPETNEEIHSFIRRNHYLDRIGEYIDDEGVADEHKIIQELTSIQTTDRRSHRAREAIKGTLRERSQRLGDLNLQHFREYVDSNRNLTLHDYLTFHAPELNKTEYLKSESFRRHRVKAREQSQEKGFEGNKAAINNLINRAQTLRKRRGAAGVMQPLLENVTDGICDPAIPGSLRFGIELEFEFPDGTSTSEAEASRLSMLKAMRENKLTSQRGVGEYHYSERAGWQEWALEEDATVTGGEIVSPVLADTPQSWKELGLILNIIKRFGGIATFSTGSHVNISASIFSNNVASNVELLRIIEDHKQGIFRIAADPVVGRHRGLTYCKPLVTTPRGDVSSYDPDFRGLLAQGDTALNDDFTTGQAAHGAMVNIENAMNDDPSSRVEFRMWDATLDLATIQAQVAISAALVDYAQYKVTTTGYSLVRDYTEEKYSGNLRLSVADLSDKIFSRHADRVRMLALYSGK